VQRTSDAAPQGNSGFAVLASIKGQVPRQQLFVPPLAKKPKSRQKTKIGTPGTLEHWTDRTKGTWEKRPFFFLLLRTLALLFVISLISRLLIHIHIHIQPLTPASFSPPCATLATHNKGARLFQRTRPLPSKAPLPPRPPSVSELCFLWVVLFVLYEKFFSQKKVMTPATTQVTISPPSCRPSFRVCRTGGSG
jgi:hypothetical protein